MPILVPAKDDRPLDQGDLLDNIVTSVAVVGDAPEVETTSMLVVSRPCNAQRDAEVVIARVSKRSLTDLRELETLNDVVGFFKGLRDGDGAPDSFYLGELDPGSSERYFARFDTLHTIKIPTEAGQRTKFLNAHRRFRLAADFTRDLHQRLFRAFASLGFDDDNWWTDEDLKFLVAKGGALKKTQEALVETAKSEVTTLEIAAAGQKDKNRAKHQVAQAEKQLAKTNEILEPLIREHRARFGAGSG
jgi:hypothetical protein